MNEIKKEGLCPECGLRYYGWALRPHGNERCVKCGGALMVIGGEEGVLVHSGPAGRVPAEKMDQAKEHRENIWKGLRRCEP